MAKIEIVIDRSGDISRIDGIPDGFEVNVKDYCVDDHRGWVPLEDRLKDDDGEYTEYEIENITHSEP